MSPLPKDPMAPSAKKVAMVYLRTAMTNNGLLQSCLTCRAFNEKEELCGLAMKRPPARIITYGCESWVDAGKVEPLPFLPKPLPKAKASSPSATPFPKKYAPI
jgi:hypothetical protein